MEFEKVYIYRITHIKNIPHILTHGITHRNSINSNPDYEEIGDTSLISTRNSKKVYINNGDFSVKGESIILGDYIPFYFGVRMPMLYVVQHGGNFVKKPVPPSDIIYLACPLFKVITEQDCYYYTNGHATEYLTSFFDKSTIHQLLTNINWQAVTARYWGGSENLTLKWQKQAEFLAKNDVSPFFVTNFVCYNEIAKNKLINMGINSTRIKVVPEAYY